MMALGRIFIGMVAGIGSGIVPVYFSEISPTRIRGAVSTVHQLGITIGILLAQLLSTPSLHILGSEDKWRYLFVVPAAAAVFELLLLPFCPESPSYLCQTKGPGAARAALRKLLKQTGEVSDAYIAKTVASIESELSARDESEGINSNSKNNNKKDNNNSTAASTSNNYSGDVVMVKLEGGQAVAGADISNLPDVIKITTPGNSAGNTPNYSNTPESGNTPRGRSSSVMTRATDRMTVMQLFKAKHLRKQLFVGVFIQMSMQLSGHADFAVDLAAALAFAFACQNQQTK